MTLTDAKIRTRIAIEQAETAYIQAEKDICTTIDYITVGEKKGRLEALKETSALLNRICEDEHRSIRCIDCKNWNAESGYCKALKITTTEHNYCGKAVRLQPETSGTRNVILCKDCKAFDAESCVCWVTGGININGENNFCSWAERKDNTKND